jgi:hypothetical protein
MKTTKASLTKTPLKNLIYVLRNAAHDSRHQVISFKT